MRPTTLLLLLLPFLLIACAQHEIQKPSGEVVKSTTVLAKGGLAIDPAGNVAMFTDADEAAKQMGDWARTALMISLYKAGIEAAKELGETITTEVGAAQATP